MRRQVLVALGWAIAAAVIVPTAIPRLVGPGTGRIDFDILLRAAGALAQGRNLYDLSHELEHTKIPLLTFYFIPFTWLPKLAARVVWDLLTVGSFLGVGLYLARKLRPPKGLSPSEFGLLGMLLLLNPWNTEVWTGQANTLLLIGVLVAASAGPAWWRGFCLLFVMLFKPPFLLFLPWIWKHGEKPGRLVAGAAGVGIASVALFLIFLGPQIFVTTHAKWMTFLPQSNLKHLPRLVNLGLPSALAAKSTLPHLSELILLAGLVVSAAVAARAEKFRAFCVIAVLVLLCSPMTWYQNYVIAIGFFLVLIKDLLEARLPMERGLLAVALLAVFVSFALNSPDIRRLSGALNFLFTNYRAPLHALCLALAAWGLSRSVRESSGVLGYSVEA